MITSLLFVVDDGTTLIDLLLFINMLERHNHLVHTICNMYLGLINCLFEMPIIWPDYEWGQMCMKCTIIANIIFVSIYHQIYIPPILK